MLARSFLKSCARVPPHLTRLDGLLLFVPLFLWPLAFCLRPHIMDLQCHREPSLCTADKLSKLDQMGIDLRSERADAWSFITQDTSGVVGIIVPIALQVSYAFARKVTWPVALAVAGTDFVILLESVLWNGAVNETTRLLVQRPRPFVYDDPVSQGQNPAHYTSFYSGHTSFVATILVGLVWVLLGRGVGVVWVSSVAGVAAFLSIATGVLRVAAGRHFPSDVIMGAVMGAVIATTLALVHRRHRRSTRL